ITTPLLRTAAQIRALLARRAAEDNAVEPRTEHLVSLTAGSLQRFADHFDFAPASSATAPSEVCVAFSPSLKSLSENVANRSVGWCQVGFHPAPVCMPRSFSRRLIDGTKSMNGVES